MYEKTGNRAQHAGNKPDQDGSAATETAAKPAVRSLPDALAAHAFAALDNLKNERSGLPLDVLEERLRTAVKNVLGDPLAPGIVIQFGTRNPQLHLADVALDNSLRNLEAFQGRFLEALDTYQTIHAFTASKAAFRVMSVILRKLCEEDPELRGAFRDLRKEADLIDLHKPADPNWRRELLLKIRGESLRLQVGLKKASLALRVVQNAIPTDIPKQDRTHQYGYDIQVSRAERTETPALTGAKNFIRRAGVIGTMLAPSAVVAGYMAINFPGKLLPPISKSKIIQGMLEFGVDLLPIAATAAATAAVLIALQRRRTKRGPLEQMIEKE